jgi:antitoxin ParD1/3/4
MAASQTTVALPSELMDAVMQAVDSGEYASSGDVVREALQEWVHNRTLSPETSAGLGELWRQAIENTQPGVPADEVLDRLERKYQARADRTASSH